MNINIKIQYIIFNNKLFLNSAKDGFNNKFPIFFQSNNEAEDVRFKYIHINSNNITINLAI